MARLDGALRPDRGRGGRRPHRGQTKTYAVRIELALPGHDLVVSREPVGDLHEAMTAASATASAPPPRFVERSRGA
ncbi:MAG: hypothetical protein R3D25_02790 [Geminicoccaceae bacterium]